MRKKPYTEIGIRRIPCARCASPSVHQWQVCADDNVYRGLCSDCDVKLNAMVLKWMGFKDWKQKITKYNEEKAV